MCSLTIQTEGAVNLIFGKSNPLMSAYKWEAYGSSRVAPAYTASSDLFFDPCVVPTGLSLVVTRWDSCLFHRGFFSEPWTWTSVC